MKKWTVTIVAMFLTAQGSLGADADSPELSNLKDSLFKLVTSAQHNLVQELEDAKNAADQIARDNKKLNVLFKRQNVLLERLHRLKTRKQDDPDLLIALDLDQSLIERELRSFRERFPGLTTLQWSLSRPAQPRARDYFLWDLYEESAEKIRAVVTRAILEHHKTDPIACLDFEAGHFKEHKDCAPLVPLFCSQFGSRDGQLFVNILDDQLNKSSRPIHSEEDYKSLLFAKLEKTSPYSFYQQRKFAFCRLISAYGVNFKTDWYYLPYHFPPHREPLWSLPLTNSEDPSLQELKNECTSVGPLFGLRVQLEMLLRPSSRPSSYARITLREWRDNLTARMKFCQKEVHDACEHSEIRDGRIQLIAFDEVCSKQILSQVGPDGPESERLTLCQEAADVGFRWKYKETDPRSCKKK